MIKQGDFTQLAKAYKNRPAYSAALLEVLFKTVDRPTKKSFKIAEVGAGTGKLTRMLAERDVPVDAVEPNDAMRNEGIEHTKGLPVRWSVGTGEETHLAANTYDWALMASSFHWTDPARSLPEFHRILKAGGYFTAIWNPRNIESSPLHMRIEKLIYDIAPEIKRVSSGGTTTKPWEKILASTGHFADVVFMEIDHTEVMDNERYMGAWRSVNDIRAQAGEEKFAKMLAAIEHEIRDLKQIEVPYKIRAWTGRVTK